MTWTKLDDTFVEHPKVVSLSDRAFRLHVSALVYSSRNLTDGHLEKRGISTLQAILGFRLNRFCEELVQNGNWIRTENGYLIHDFLDCNPTAEEVKKRREQAKKRMRTLRETSTGSTERSPVRSPERSHTPTRPVLLKTNTYTQAVSDAWGAQPNLIQHRPQQIADATRAIESAAKRHTVDDVVAAVKLYATVVASPNHYFTHRWTLKDFCTRGVDKFVPAADPLSNYLDEKSRVVVDAPGRPVPRWDADLAPLPVTA